MGAGRFGHTSAERAARVLVGGSDEDRARVDVAGRRLARCRLLPARLVGTGPPLPTGCLTLARLAGPTTGLALALASLRLAGVTGWGPGWLVALPVLAVLPVLAGLAGLLAGWLGSSGRWLPGRGPTGARVAVGVIPRGPAALSVLLTRPIRAAPGVSPASHSARR